MALLKIPKTLRWLAWIAFIMLVVFNGYRIGIYVYFYKDLVKDVALYKALWMGFRFDCRIVGIVTLFLLLISFIPGVHFFKRKSAKQIVIIFCCVIMGALLCFYALDFAHLLLTKTRLNVQMITEVKKGTAIGHYFVKKTPWITIVLMIAVAVWLFGMLIGFLHNRIGKTKSTDENWVRRYWQVVFLLAMLMGIYGRLGRTPLHGDIAKLIGNPYAAQLALNPVESFVESIGTKPLQAKQ